MWVFFITASVLPINDFTEPKKPHKGKDANH